MKRPKFKTKCERCGQSGRFLALPCCGWHACAACVGNAPKDSRGTPLCRTCVHYRERNRAAGLLAPMAPNNLGAKVTPQVPPPASVLS